MTALQNAHFAVPDLKLAHGLTPAIVSRPPLLTRKALNIPRVLSLRIMMAESLGGSMKVVNLLRDAPHLTLSLRRVVLPGNAAVNTSRASNPC
ncbi:hypothetical protein CT690_05170 [Serratia plymuthica]|uniref:Uncharacterized protein n=1 Tax=Serratia plymuthica TaxID=82996 RepID=A0A318P3W3_SERPL|nr:hypothetical protein CT690_05170 [Serratia plymuthica]